jgi:predicted nuclease of predicted toxin-antitoxin system
MTQKIRFHLDENVNGAIADGLRRHSIDVTTTADVNLIAATDELQLQFALTHRRIIFTQDTDFLKLHNAGVEHCGIVFCIKV